MHSTSLLIKDSCENSTPYSLDNYDLASYVGEDT